MTSRIPPSRREIEERRMFRWQQSTFPGAISGRLANASPLRVTFEAPGEGDQPGSGDESVSTVSFYRDHWTLSVDGTQTETFTFLPVQYSEHVYLNGIEQWEGTDWTRSDTTLSVLSPMGALAGDDLEVRYAYLEGLPTTPTDIPPLDVPFSSTGWKYTHTDPGPGWEQPNFDDSGWSTGQMPIGNSGYSTYADDNPNTVVGSTMNPTPNEIWVRRQMGPGTTIIFSYRMAKYLQVYVDGTLYTSQTFGGYHTATDLFPRIADQTGIWTLAATVYDFSWVGAGPDFDIGINLEISGDEA